VALTAAQRRRLPNSAFAYPSKRKYPTPTKAQARKAGISEAQRLRLHRNALARANQSGTSGSYRTVAKKVRARAGSAVKSTSPTKGRVTKPGMRTRRKR
jgi:hypothetical protein